MTQPVLIEVCVDSVASAVAAERGGAQRVELCSDLLEGGITPSLGLLEMVRSTISIAVHSMIRPRGGDFCYSDEEFEIMRRDIQIAKHAGADGVALGLLHPSGHVDVRRTRQLIEMARPMSVTFHRAFDVSADLQQGFADICSTGADRLLTSGGEPDSLHGIKMISQLAKSSPGRIHLMAGGGITAKNVVQILQRTGVREIHVGLATPVLAPVALRTPRVFLGKGQGKEFQRTQVLEESVRELKHAINHAVGLTETLSMAPLDRPRE